MEQAAPSTAATATAATTSVPPPSASCGVCTDFRVLRKKHRASEKQQSRSSESSSSSSSSSSLAAASVAATAAIASIPSTSTSTSTTTAAAAPYTPYPCPPDASVLGSSAWTFLHTTAAYYPSKPTESDKSTMRGFISGIARFYPCNYCATHFAEFAKKNPPRLDNNLALSTWFCEAHNDVNVRNGKPVFDCSTVLERWRTGMKDCIEAFDQEE